MNTGDRRSSVGSDQGGSVTPPTAHNSPARNPGSGVGGVGNDPPLSRHGNPDRDYARRAQLRQQQNASAHGSPVLPPGNPTRTPPRDGTERTPTQVGSGGDDREVLVRTVERTLERLRREQESGL